jgi:predicted secreted protein
MLILVGDGATPEVFAAPCGLTSKGFDTAASSNEVAVPDCDDPDAPAWIERVVKSLSSKVTGSGVLAAESFDVWRDWSLSGLAKNVRVELQPPTGSTGLALGYYAGSFILSAFSLKAALGDKVTVDVTMDSDGQVTWVPVP